MKESLKKIECGDIYYLNLKYRFGHEYKGLRPYVVIDCNEFLSFSNVVCIAPLTSRLSNDYRFDILIKRSNDNKLKTDSLVKLAHLDTVDKRRLQFCIGRISKDDIRQIHSNLRKRFNL